MRKVSTSGRDLMSTTDPGRPCKKTSLDFYGQLIPVPFTMLSIAAVSVYIVIDFSRAAAETDFRPSRMAIMAKHVEAFIREFFDQNPLSQIGLVSIKNGIAHTLTDLGGSHESHIQALMGKLEAAGDSSLQNSLELVHEHLSQIPSYGHREVLILYSALSTSDPGYIMETIQKCKKSRLRCSVIELSVEMFICKRILFEHQFM